MSAAHKSLAAWQSAHRVVALVLDASVLHWKPPLQAVFGQLQRASLSVQLNIAEGYAHGRGSGRCRDLLRVAYGSAVETRELIDILAERGALPPDLALEVLEANRRSQVTLQGLIRRY